MTREEFDKLVKDKTYDDVIYDLLKSIDKLEKQAEDHRYVIGKCLVAIKGLDVQLRRHETYMNSTHPHCHSSEAYNFFNIQKP